MSDRCRYPPGPTSPFFGFPLLRQMRHDYIGSMQQLHADHGDLVCMRIAWERVYAVFHPDLMRQVLVDKASRFIRLERNVEVFAALHGQSVLVTEGETWKRQRRMLQPGFGAKRMDGYAQAMVAAASQALDALPPDKVQTLDFEHQMTLLTMDVIMRTLFSSDAKADALAAERAIRYLSHYGMEEMFNGFSTPDWMPHKARMRRERAGLDGLIRRHVAQRQSVIRAGQNSPDDLLGMLLAVRDDQGGDRNDRLSDEEVRDQCMTIFLAGHETTATALTWWGYLMAKNSECAQQAAQEVDAVLQGRVPSYDDLPKLAYLDQCLRESMRLYPPVASLMARRVVQDVQIGDWHMPRGAVVLLPVYTVQRDARWFAEPDRFDPMRFSPEHAPQFPRGAYMPFGAGPRVCLGQVFATTEMTLVAAMILQRFKLSLVSSDFDPRPTLNVTLRPAQGLPLCLTRRSA